MFIELKSREECLNIARDLKVDNIPEDDLLCSIPDELFGTIQEVSKVLGGGYLTVDGYLVPSSFIISCYDGIISGARDTDKLSYCGATNIRSNELVFNSDIGYVIKIDLKTGIVHVNPDIIDKQPEAIAKQVLECLDDLVLQTFNRG